MKPLLILLTALLSAFCAQGQDWAKARLENSPRHGEWVDVTNGATVVRCFIVYPEVKNPAPAVLVVHEIFGLTDWARGVADQLAEAGYVAIAPDFLTGMGPHGGGTSDFKSSDDVRNVIFKLTPEIANAELDAAAAYVKKLPSVNGKIAVAGFCWGGGQAFQYACHNPDLKAAYVFYGLGPTADDMKKIQCPVYGFYGENDARISSTIQAAEQDMKADGKTYQPVLYTGAGHGFMRSGEAPNATPANHKARDDAWARWKTLLQQL